MSYLIKKIIRVLPKIISGFLIVAFAAALNGSLGNSFSNNIFAPKIAEAAFNKEINYQGKLTNTSNVAVADGNYIMKFRLYTSATGATTTNIWEEIRTATGDKASVSNGLFSVLLGSSTPLTTVDFNQTLYLGVEVCGTVGLSGCDDEMSPRKKLGAVPAAFEADKIDGLSSEQFLRSDAVNSTTTATTFLTFTQNGAGKIAEFIGPNSVPVFSLLSGGNVGVGTTSPWAKFSINNFTGDTGQPLFVIASSTATATTTQFIVTNTGKVGIGSTTPSAMLSITGVAPTSGNADTVLSVFGGAGATGGNGGIGGGIVLVAGNASNPQSGNGLTGGTVTISSGNGSAGASLSGVGADGGTLSITTGSGGAGGIVSGAEGNGGNIELTTGAGGTAGGAADGFYGNIIMVKNGGNVGIGTTSPYAKLSVVGPVVAEYFHATSTTATSTIAGGLVVDTDTLVVDYSSGRVGIGTTSPLAILSLAGTSPNILITDNAQVTGSKAWAMRNTDTNLQFIATTDIGGALTSPLTLARGGFLGVSSSTPSFPLSVLGNSYLKGTLLVDSGNLTMSKTAPYLILSDSSQGADLKQFQLRNESQLLKIVAANDAGSGLLQIITIDRSGNFGIASNTPSKKLSVVGDAGISGALDFGTISSIKMVYEGDSLSNDAVDWPGYLITKSGFFGRATQINVATGGETVATMVTQYATQVTPNAPSRNVDEGYFYILGGTNDLNAARTAVQIYADLKTEWQNARADKFKVIAFTVLPSTSFTAGEEAERIILNNLIANDSTYYDYLIRPEVFFTDATDTTYFSDGTHLTTTGASLLADMVYNAMYKNPFLIVQNTATTTMSGVNLILNPIGQNTGIGTTSPYARLTVWGVGTGTGKTFEAVNNASTSLLTVLDNGNVGIGTTSPYAKLSVVGPVVAEYFHATSTTATSTIAGGLVVDTDTLVVDYSSGRVGIGTTSPSAKLSVTGAGTGTGRAFAIANSSNAEKFTVLDNGSVGIGTTTMQGLLNLGPDSTANTGGIWFGSDTNLYRSAANTLKTDDYINVGANIVLQSTGNAYASGFYSSIFGASSAVTMTFQNRSFTVADNAVEMTTGTWTNSSGEAANLNIRPTYNQTGTANSVDLLITRTDTVLGSGTHRFADFKAGGTSKFNVSNAGVVGIATSSPWRTLSVVGTVAFNGLTSSSVGNAVCIATTKDIIDAGGTVCTSSSLRFKENVKTLEGGFGFDTLSQLRVVSFDYKKDSYSPEDRKESYGFVAEEVERIDPNLVDYGYDGKPFTLKFEKILGLTVQAVQEMRRDLSFGFIVENGRSAVRNVSRLDEQVFETYLDKIKNINISTYRQATDSPGTTRLGIIGDDAPSEILSPNGGVDIYKLAVFTLGGVKAQQLKIDSLEQRINAIEESIARGGGGGAGLAMDAILENLKNLGADITNGLAYFRGLIADTLTVGSSEKPTGITLYDDVTGKPYCVKISNGKLKNISGKCEDALEPTDEPKDGSASSAVSSGGTASSVTSSSVSSLSSVPDSTSFAPAFEQNPDSEPAEVKESGELLIETESAGEISTPPESQQEPKSESAVAAES